MKEKVADGVNGLHFRVASAEDLADKLTYALEDPQAWERLRTAAPKPIGHEEAAQQHMALYRRVRDSGKRTALPTSTGRVEVERQARTA
jgi:glycosyltransferase involved in cell wall biosynthesis